MKAGEERVSGDELGERRRNAPAGGASSDGLRLNPFAPVRADVRSDHGHVRAPRTRLWIHVAELAREICEDLESALTEFADAARLRAGPTETASR